VIPALAYSLVAAGLLLGLWCAVLAGRGRPTDDPVMIAAIVFEVALLAQSVLGLVRLRGAGLAEPATFIAYAVGILLVLPLGFQLARIERTRWGSGALAFTAVVGAVMTLRLLQLWRSQ